MESKIIAKRATLDVIETIRENMETAIQYKRDTVSAYEQQIAEGATLAPWEDRERREAGAYIAAWDAIAKGLEKLI